jgi:hypothetical protein
MARGARVHMGSYPSHVTQSGNRWQKAIYVYCPRKPRNPKSCDAERQSLAEGDICVLSPETVPGNLAKKESYRNPVPDVFMR